MRWEKKVKNEKREGEFNDDFLREMSFYQILVSIRGEKLQRKNSRKEREKSGHNKKNWKDLIKYPLFSK